MHKNKLGAQNIGENGIAGAKGRDEPVDLYKPPGER